MRTFTGASASRLSGISRMSGSALGAMKFMPFSMEDCIGAAGTALSGRPAPALPTDRLGLRATGRRACDDLRASAACRRTGPVWMAEAKACRKKPLLPAPRRGRPRNAYPRSRPHEGGPGERVGLSARAAGYEPFGGLRWDRDFRGMQRESTPQK